MTPDPDRYDALVALVSKPCVFDWLRSHKVTVDGKPDRHAQWKDLPMRYVTITRGAREDEA
jgi:hypothetical protein